MTYQLVLLRCQKAKKKAKVHDGIVCSGCSSAAFKLVPGTLVARSPDMSRPPVNLGMPSDQLHDMYVAKLLAALPRPFMLLWLDLPMTQHGNQFLCSARPECMESAKMTGNK
ncbi:hypothetical protein M441DRAFT_414824 [Trichoderma asperellum CBS 433.97]|uniref:Uncharacterized protein n=1 Tax=Trichoderma asperellum (strain ATCC 204424 / CBS 433.97 / NBRC 101777) TaxID=1042311 RepID=A0A2T3Z7Y5_TRIA4|nr:hypothetical protein M441DRAFT_414824 [Trichoderma asperellum CBS 433.97]PTB40919.1 hypothetical protein M441DRAFT_414824 [Trichoderma asperellum CBS 433.97]